MALVLMSVLFFYLRAGRKKSCCAPKAKLQVHRGSGKIVYLRGTNRLQIAHACSMNIYSAVFGAKHFVNTKERKIIDWQGCLALRFGGDGYN